MRLLFDEQLSEELMRVKTLVKDVRDFVAAVVGDAASSAFSGSRADAGN